MNVTLEKLQEKIKIVSEANPKYRFSFNEMTSGPKYLLTIAGKNLRGEEAHSHIMFFENEEAQFSIYPYAGKVDQVKQAQDILGFISYLLPARLIND